MARTREQYRCATVDVSSTIIVTDSLQSSIAGWPEHDTAALAKIRMNPRDDATLRPWGASYFLRDRGLRGQQQSNNLQYFLMLRPQYYYLSRTTSCVPRQAAMDGFANHHSAPATTTHECCDPTSFSYRIPNRPHWICEEAGELASLLGGSCSTCVPRTTRHPTGLSS